MRIRIRFNIYSWIEKISWMKLSQSSSDPTAKTSMSQRQMNKKSVKSTFPTLIFWITVNRGKPSQIGGKSRVKAGLARHKEITKQSVIRELHFFSLFELYSELILGRVEKYSTFWYVHTLSESSRMMKNRQKCINLIGLLGIFVNSPL